MHPNNIVICYKVSNNSTDLIKSKGGKYNPNSGLWYIHYHRLQDIDTYSTNGCRIQYIHNYDTGRQLDKHLQNAIIKIANNNYITETNQEMRDKHDLEVLNSI